VLALGAGEVITRDFLMGYASNKWRTLILQGVWGLKENGNDNGDHKEAEEVMDLVKEPVAIDTAGFHDRVVDGYTVICLS